MSSSEDFNIFNDCKFSGVDKINNICSTNLATSNKFLRIFKDFYFAQDLYVKALLKINSNLSQLSNDKSDGLNPILNFFSITFCVFTNVQKEFSYAINKIIKNLTTSCDEKNGHFVKAFSSHQLNVISEFKNTESHLNKAKQKYFSMHDLCKNGNSVDNEKNERLLKKSKELYQIAVVNYNKSRLNFLHVFEEGFNLSKLNYFAHLDNMRKCTKEFGNALAKLVFDMKDSVQSLKQYYRSFDKEEIFQLWTESNKTISNSKLDPFPEAVMEIPENSDKVNTEWLIDLEPTSESNHCSIPTENPRRRSVESRKMSHNMISSGYGISDSDSTDFPNQDSSTKNKNNEKTNIHALKSAKKKRSIFSSLMKFKSTSDLADEDKKNTDNENEVREENWQSRSNLNSAVLLDDEGYIIRDSKDDGMRRFSDSSYSSDSSFGNKIQPLKKLNIKPISDISKIPDTNSELMSAAMQLPLPKRQKEKHEITKKISNLQRSTRPVSYLMKDKLYRRSMSVSELQSMKNETDSLVDESENKTNTNMNLQNDHILSMPIACAVTEVISSDIVKHVTNIQGQIIIAFPLSLKQFLFETTHKLPSAISFHLMDNLHLMTSIQITNQLEDIVKLKKINDKKYLISIVTENLKKCLSNEYTSKIKFQISNRISAPILEYFASTSGIQEKVISCQARWALSQMPYVQFDFILSSMWFKNNKPTSVEVKILTEGIIEDVFSKESLQIEKLNNQCWKIYYEMSDNRVSLKIKTINQKFIKLRMNYEFTFEKLSLVNPEMAFNNNEESSNLNFNIKLMHYRTMSTGNFSEIFEYSIP